MLEAVDLSLTLSRPAFKQVMRGQQERLAELADLSFERRVPVVIVFEGWDAAGKGTNIRRLTQRLDPRGFKVLPTRAPMPHELNKPWLWRFWMHIPRHGQIAIFDLSWYGRVLVERVEGLTAIPDWIRAYEEINAFERTLAADGTLIVKFFLHISREEQLRRFVLLTQHPETAWQVTADDWEHHRRYDEYVRAVEDMLASTSTPEGGMWEVVPATNREYCSYHVFRTVIRRLEEALGVDPLAEPDLEALELEAERERVRHDEKRLASKEAKSKKKAESIAARAEAKTAKTEAKTFKAEAKTAKAEAKTAKAEAKTAKAAPRTASTEKKGRSKAAAAGEVASQAKPVAEAGGKAKTDAKGSEKAAARANSKKSAKVEAKAKIKPEDKAGSKKKMMSAGPGGSAGAHARHGDGAQPPAAILLDEDAEGDDDA